MRRLGRTGKADSNQADIVDALRLAGWDVISLSGQGYGCPDLIAYHHARQALRLIEVKRAKQKLTAAQKTLQARGWPVTVVRSPEEALKI
jgi:Holliday junction resolvase